MVRDIGPNSLYGSANLDARAKPTKVPPRSFERKVAMLAKVFGVQPTDIVYVTQGKDKILFRVEVDTYRDNIYVLPVQSFLGMRRKNSENEAKFAQTISSNLKLSESEESHLVFLSKDKEHFSMPDAKVKNASLEEQIPEIVKNEKNPFPKLKSFCLDFVKGMKQLHDAGGLHGDIKLDNLLHFSTGKVKVSDFGKGALVKGDEPKGLYSGNTRSAPPEGKRSKPGDVYSTGINLIKMLEAPFLSETTKSLVTAPKITMPEKVPRAHKSRWGIEAYILNNPAFTRSYEDKGSYKGKLLNFSARVRNCAGLVTEKELTDEQTALNGYIKALCDTLEKSKNLTPDKATALDKLLRSMTQINPNIRPNMMDVEKALSRILT